MKTRLHANATTTPKVRALIQGSGEPVAALARRFGVSETTIRRWRGRSTTEDRSHVRHRLGQATTPEDEALIRELRLRAWLSVDDITEVMNRCVHPGLSAGSVWRALRRMGLSGRAARPAGLPARHFDPAPFGYVHVDLKYLPKLQGRGEFAFVAIERATRFAHAEVLPDRAAATVAAAWGRFLAAFAEVAGGPGQVHTVLTDNGSEFTDRFADGAKSGHAARPTGTHPFDRICAAQGIRHRCTRPYRPQTNGMAERFNRRLGEAMGRLPPIRDNARHRTRFHSHAEREAFLLAFVHDYNRTRLRCLAYRAPLEVLTNLLGHNTLGAVGRRPASLRAAFRARGEPQWPASASHRAQSAF
jgi:transposase InsO family protein